jgi:hypothetical protein
MYDYIRITHDPDKTTAQQVGKLLHKHKAEFVKDHVWKVESSTFYRLQYDMAQLNQPFNYRVFWQIVNKPN